MSFLKTNGDSGHNHCFGIKFQFFGHFIKKRDQNFLKTFETDEDNKSMEFCC